MHFFSQQKPFKSYFRHKTADATLKTQRWAACFNPAAVPPFFRPGDLSTKLKLLGVNVASFGANAEFWKHRMYDFQDGQVWMAGGGVERIGKTTMDILR